MNNTDRPVWSFMVNGYPITGIFNEKPDKEMAIDIQQTLILSYGKQLKNNDKGMDERDKI